MDEITAEFKIEDIKKKAQEQSSPEPLISPINNPWLPFWVGFGTMITAGGIIVWMWIHAS